uniref:Putative secreted protein n=1 Tax=Ixodes ricinus TaxID=34613 RepID=A0A6B0U3L6_IXORI
MSMTLLIFSSSSVSATGYQSSRGGLFPKVGPVSCSSAAVSFRKGTTAMVRLKTNIAAQRLQGSTRIIGSWVICT